MRLVFEPHGWGLNLGRGGRTEEKKEEEEEEEKIPHMCESIGHRPLRGRCPKGNSQVWNSVDGGILKFSKPDSHPISNSAMWVGCSVISRLR